MSYFQSCITVYQHGCTWRYEFNARKSAVLVYGEDYPRDRGAAIMREFCLGEAKVKQRLSYDHIGIRTSVDEDEVSRIEERLAKARTTLNTATGLGIRKYGLTMATCNVIFWSLVTPTALYGCEIWRLNGNAVALLETFQHYAAKKIQRFYSGVPNSCCLYALGWMRLERFIQVKKLMFIRSILILDDRALSRIVFCQRALLHFRRGHADAGEVGYSIVYDLLKTAQLFNLYDDVRNMVERGQQLSKHVWKEKVWGRAWELEDVYWQI